MAGGDALQDGILYDSKSY